MLKGQFFDIYQIFVNPIGWVPVTRGYNPARPQEFPIANNLFEVFYHDAITVRPLPEKNNIRPVTFSNFKAELVQPQ